MITWLSALNIILLACHSRLELKAVQVDLILAKKQQEQGEY